MKNEIIYSKEDILRIKSSRNLCIAGLLLPLIAAIACSIIEYRIHRRIPNAIAVFIGAFIPIFHFFMIFIYVSEANKIIKNFSEDRPDDSIITEEDISQYENEVTIDEDALKRYLSHKKQ